MTVLTRTSLTLVAVAATLLALPFVARAGGDAVIEDFKHNGQIDGCYTSEEYAAALESISPESLLYGETIDAIQAARISHLVERTGDPCPEGLPPATGDAPEREPASGGFGRLAVIVGALGVVAVGVGVLVGRRRDDRDGR